MFCVCTDVERGGFFFVYVYFLARALSFTIRMRAEICVQGAYQLKRGDVSK
jgi:hypothetical protein